MKIKQAFKLALGAFSVAATVGQLSGATVTSPGSIGNGTSFTDNFPHSSVATANVGLGTTASRYEFDVTIFGRDACIVIDPFEAADTAGTVLYNTSVALDVDIINNTGFDWNSTHIRLFQDNACTIVSPDTDQWSFAQNVGGLNAVQPPFVVTDVFDFITGPPVLDGASVKAQFTLSNGSVLGSINPPFSMRIIPEPSAVALLGLGVLGFFFRRRRA
ncbi:MAG TPA: PEP-CTERM sorting domain-containing protein [Verrucomicrobiales bacterium]|nr:PEP-CTERM sorting domain-containing protein [Verrucomicrobiales bacterium]